MENRLLLGLAHLAGYAAGNLFGGYAILIQRRVYRSQNVGLHIRIQARTCQYALKYLAISVKGGACSTLCRPSRSLVEYGTDACRQLIFHRIHIRQANAVQRLSDCRHLLFKALLLSRRLGQAGNQLVIQHLGQRTAA